MPHPRKEEAANREREKKLKAREEVLRKVEDAKWIDNDKSLAAKEARKAEKDAKADQQARSQREKAELLLREEAENSSKGKNVKLQSTKVRQSDIRISALSAIVLDPKKKKPSQSAAPSNLVHDQPLEPNLNKEAMIQELRTGVKVESGSGTAEALSAITAALGDLKLDPHPEKRMKALHMAFEERRLKELMAEKPNLKRSQYQEIIWKEWQKSPENPMRTPPLNS
jgi:hypothetical protein